MSWFAKEVQRLDYAAKRAERQYNSVDPENRLIAATLEKKWEGALAELQQAQTRLTEAKAQSPDQPPSRQTCVLPLLMWVGVCPKYRKNVP
jgi:hypothetical protein